MAKTIEIAPSMEHTTITSEKIEGYIDRPEEHKREIFTFTFNQPLCFPKSNHDAWKQFFSTAIFMARYGEDVERAFAMYDIKGKMSCSECEI